MSVMPTHQHGHPFRRALIFGLLMLAGGFGVLNWRIWNSTPDISPISATNPGAVATPAVGGQDEALAPVTRSATEFPQTKDRPLFTANRRPVDRTPKAIEEVAKRPQAALIPLDQFQLVGIMRTGSAQARVLIRNKTDGQGAWIGVGERFRGWQLREIAGDITVLEANGQRGELQLYRPTSAAIR